MSILPFGPRRPQSRRAQYGFVGVRRETGIVGLFWHQPTSRQNRRIAELRRSGLSAETVAILCRRPLAEVQAIVEASPESLT
jgi:hypothetical protein